MMAVWRALTEYVSNRNAVPNHIVVPDIVHQELLVELASSLEARRHLERGEPLKIGGVEVIPARAEVRGITVGR